MNGMGMDVSLILAATDLKLVKLIRGAMRAADAQAGAAGPIVPQRRFEPRPVVHPTPRFESRPVHEPTPRFEPRPVYQPTPRVEESAPPTDPGACRRDKTSKLLPPPWKQPAWQIPTQPSPIVKKIVMKPDIITKGTLLDFFI